MRILIACEFSGIVRDAFLEYGHDAYSCDLEASERPGPHYQCDVRERLNDGWDMLIAFPPCTYLCSSGARWWAQRQDEQQAALAFVRCLLDAPIPRIALENPVGCLSTAIRKPDQIVYPWEHGDRAMKKTCLWLKNLPLLQPATLVWPRPQLAWLHGQTASRSRNRSRTYTGIAMSMADQWGKVGIAEGKERKSV